MPFVSVEPAPVDIWLTVLGGALLVLWVVPVPMGWLLGLLVYLTLSLVGALSSGELLDLSAAETKYFVIELYLALAVTVMYSLSRWSRDATTRFIEGVVWGAIGSSIIVLAFRFGAPSTAWIYRDETQLRLKGTFKDPNVLAPFLVLPILLVFFRWSRVRFVHRLGAIPMLVALYMTLSRGAFVALGVGALLTALLIGLRRGFTAVRAAAFIMTIAVMIAAAPFLSAKLSAVADETAANRLSYQSYDDDRFASLIAAVEESADHPLGLGVGEFTEVYGNNPHNLLLGKSVDVGIIPALMLTGWILLGFVRAVRLYWREPDPYWACLAGTLAGNIVLSGVIYSHHWRHLLIFTAIAHARFRPSRHEATANGPRIVEPVGIVGERT